MSTSKPSAAKPLACWKRFAACWSFCPIAETPDEPPSAFHHERKPLEPIWPPMERNTFLPLAFAAASAAFTPSARVKSVVLPPPFFQISPGSVWTSVLPEANDRKERT
jgi:hypothetical protein